MIVGSLLLGADELVGEMVKSRVAIGVIRRGQLVGGVVYHAYRTFDIQLSAAFDTVGWALPGTVRALLAYPFNELGVSRVTAFTGRKNKKAKKLLTDLGFTLEGVAKRGLDGIEDAFAYGLLREDCRWLKHGKETADASRAA
jgi:hypothetical protein